MDIICCEGNENKVEISKRVPNMFIREKLVIIEGGDDEWNRKVLESKNVDILLDPHQGFRRDKIYQKDSGLNEVLCQLAKENDIAIGFSLSLILNTKDRAELFGRIIQNIELCQKYKVKIVIGTFAKNKNELRNFKDVEALFKILGLRNYEKDFVKKRLEFKKKFIRKGVMEE
jgi:RNase P/RNase MRP subunit p30